MFNSKPRGIFISLLVSFVFLSGCVAPLIIGGILVTGYAIAKDTVSGNVDATFDQLWDSSLKVVSDTAEISSQNLETGVIKGFRGNDTITVKIRELTRHTHNLRVSCRKSLAFTNLSLAQQIFTEIINNLKTDRSYKKSQEKQYYYRQDKRTY